MAREPPLTNLSLVPTFLGKPFIQGLAKVGLQMWVRETQSLFLYYYVLIILLLSIHNKFDYFLLLIWLMSILLLDQPQELRRVEGNYFLLTSTTQPDFQLLPSITPTASCRILYIHPCDSQIQSSHNSCNDLSKCKVDHIISRFKYYN